MVNYAFVLDSIGNRLMPTKTQKAWYLIRKGRAKLISKYPMTIQLLKTIPKDEICKDQVYCGIDDGSKHVGIALVQKCKTKNKVLIKGTLEQRNDVKKLMEQRRGYRRYRRYHKRYRAARFHNRHSAIRHDRVAPSILQKRQAIIRVMKQLLKWIRIDAYFLEDVVIDVRAITDGHKPYKWQYQKTNRLDENIRKAVILRDGCKCQECGKTNCRLEVHHIKPRRLNGSNTIKNLITLCKKCHQATKGCEEKFMERYYKMTHMNSGWTLCDAMHVMIGKTWLHRQLKSLGPLSLTTGGDTSNKRIDWNIPKSHSNDAICITGLQPDTWDIKEWSIKPMRRQSKAKTDNVMGIKHRDLVSYTFRNGETHTGYVTALYPKQNALNFQSPTKHCKKVNAAKCKLLWTYNKIYWFDATL